MRSLVLFLIGFCMVAPALADKGRVGDYYHAVRVGKFSPEIKGGNAGATEYMKLDDGRAYFYAFGQRKSRKFRLEFEMGYSEWDGTAFGFVPGQDGLYLRAAGYEENTITDVDGDGEADDEDNGIDERTIVETVGASGDIGDRTHSQALDSKRLQFMVHFYRDFQKRIGKYAKPFVGIGFGYIYGEYENQLFAQNVLGRFKNPGVVDEPLADQVPAFPHFVQTESQVRKGRLLSLQLGINYERIEVSWRWTQSPKKVESSMIHVGFKF